MFRTVLASAVVLVGCKSSDGGGGDMDLDNKGSGSAKGSSSGFSAELSESKDSAKPPDKKPPDKTPDKVPDKAPDKAPDKTPDKAGSGSSVVDKTPDKAGSGSSVVDKTPDKAGSGSSTARPPDKVPDGAGSAKVAMVPAPPVTDKPRVPVKPSPELAAIKLSLDPNWDRDVGEAGTISFALKKPSGDQAIFSFSYGYDDPKAPADRDAYMKWLGEQKILTVELNRQRGSAWYLQGTDTSGAPAFRYLVNYGGKHLICGGLLYKDAESSRLGDLRDKVIIQAKEICETLAL